MCFLRKILRKIDLFLRFIFCKNVHADFYGLSEIDSVVTDFDPNNKSSLCETQSCCNNPSLSSSSVFCLTQQDFLDSKASQIWELFVVVVVVV